MRVYNDKNCSWINNLKPRNNIKLLDGKKLECDWLIVGAVWIIAARKLSELKPNQKII